VAVGRSRADAPEIDGKVYIAQGEHKLRPGQLVDVRIERADEALGPAAMLHVGLAVGARCCEERGVDLCEEVRQLVGDLGRRATRCLHAGICLA